MYHIRVLRDEEWKKINSNHMNINSIYKLDNIKFIDNITTPQQKNVNNTLRKICKAVFIEAYNNGGKESGAVLNTDTLEYVIIEATKYNEVIFNEYEKYTNIRDSSENYSCVEIHTHNADARFSVVDVITALNNNKVHSIIVITSECNIYILCKERNKNYAELSQELHDRLLWDTDYIHPEIYKKLKANNLYIRRLTQ